MAPTMKPEEVTGVLDDAAAVKRHDPDGMLEKVESAADQWRGMMETASQPPSEKKWRSVRDVVVAGMGGSAIAGDMVGSLLRNRWPVRIDVVRGYDLPARIGTAEHARGLLFLVGQH